MAHLTADLQTPPPHGALSAIEEYLADRFAAILLGVYASATMSDGSSRPLQPSDLGGSAVSRMRKSVG